MREDLGTLIYKTLVGMSRSMLGLLGKLVILHILRSFSCDPWALLVAF